MRLPIYLVVLVSVSVSAGAQARAPQPRAPQAAVGKARYEGTWTGDVAVFKGVPYARPPVGDLRWKPPLPNEPAGSQSATSFGAQCMQGGRLHEWTKEIAVVFGTADKVAPPTLATSEDCLTLNIWTPSLAGSAPVMVWIHGGSNIGGSGAESLYDGSELARRGTVVVSINYRLGMFGFLAHPALVAESPRHAAGNYGLLDQLEALRWVRRRIKAFGGDPARVTVFGESAGSIDIVHLMASPLAGGLFDRAIAESGAPMGRLATVQSAGALGMLFATALGVDTTGDVLARLRAKPAAEVLAAQEGFRALVLAASPVVDGWVLPDMTARIWDRGEQADVPLIIGSNALEMSTLRSYIPAFPRTIAGYRQWAAATLGGAAGSVLAHYSAADDAAVEAAALRLTTDLFMTCPVRMAARAMERAGNPTYRYVFTRVLPGGESLGAFHSAEIAYVFAATVPWLRSEPADRRLSQAMMGYWSRFAATGDPNGGGAPGWPRYEATSDSYLELGDSIAAGRGLRREACDAMDPPIRAQWSGR